MTNKLEIGYQEEVVREYETKIEIITGIDEMIRNWALEEPTNREKRWASLGRLLLTSTSSLESLAPKAVQLMNQSKTDLQNAQLKSEELHTQLRTLWLKDSLSFLGILSGLVMFCYSAVAIKTRRAN